MPIKPAGAALLSAFLLMISVLPAQATTAVPKAPITCGMVVRSSVHLYLKHDLYCPTFGVRVEYPEPEGGPVPDVSVNLRGHTLRGSGSSDARGITAFAYPGQAFLRVRNGRLENWGIAVGGDSETRVADVKLVDNSVGFFCNGLCIADRLYFKNSSLGLNVGGEASAVVTRSVFSRNKKGASVGSINSLDIRTSTFYKNDVGVYSNGAVVKVARSKFIRNHTAILVEVPSEDGCADLYKVRFKRNTHNLIGPAC